ATARSHPAERDEGHPRGVSTPRHEARLHGCGLPDHQDQAGDYIRQLRAGLRRAFRAGLQAVVFRRLPDERAVRGIAQTGRSTMKFVVTGDTGLIASKLCPILREQGHEAVAAAPNSGVNPLTGEGLAEVLQGASVVVD